MTKKEALLKALKREWLTPLEAVERVGIMSLSQRCGDLSREGWKVAKRWVDLPSGSRVMSYRVVGRA